MAISVRPYSPDTDYETVDRFLVECFVPGNLLHAWLQPRWEYMHGSSGVDNINLTDIGIAEDRGTVVGVVHPEHSPAFAYLEVRPGRGDVVPLLLDWAQAHLGGWSQSFEREMLGIFVNDRPTADLVASRGFVRDDYREAHACLQLTDLLPDVPPPPGYRLQSLAEGNDHAEINRVLWRGFNHEGPPPEDVIPSRVRAQQTPNYSLDLNIVAVDPAGHFVAYAGIWLEPTTGVAYVEPVATDPEHRRLGLGRAVVTKCLRRVRELGATIAWVGSDQEFYERLGFEVTCSSELWIREPQPQH
jgi:predicted N-acetyltransferase YhbS